MIQEYLFINNENKEKIKNFSSKEIQVEIDNFLESECWIARFLIDKNDENTAKKLSVEK